MGGGRSATPAAIALPLRLPMFVRTQGVPAVTPWTPLLIALSLITGRAMAVDVWAPGAHVRCEGPARRLADIHPGTAGSEPRELVPTERGLFFTAEDGAHGRELWSSRGAGGGTFLVKDVRPGAAGAMPRALTVMGGVLYFLADDGVHGAELWRSDGTEAGTVLVRDVRPGREGSGLHGLTVFGGRLWFAADDGVHGLELWASDGTEAGTVLVKEFTVGRGGQYLTGFTVMGGALYFVTSGGPEATLWRFDGERFLPVLRGGALFIPYALTAVGRRLFFLVDGDAEPGDDTLYVSDGTPGGTRALRTFAGSVPLGLTAADGRLVFAADDGEHGVEPWTSDGTVAGTRMVKDVRRGPEGSSPFALTVMNGRVYFSADDGVHGSALWTSDGTAAGTVRLTEGAGPAHLAAVRGTLFFSAETAERGREVWRSDGTAAGTRPLREIAPGARSSVPRELVRAGEDVFFSADDGATGAELWALPLRCE